MFGWGVGILEDVQCRQTLSSAAIYKELISKSHPLLHHLEQNPILVLVIDVHRFLIYIIE